MPSSCPAARLGHQRRMVQGLSQPPQPGHPQTVVPGQERPGRSLAGRLPRTDLHRLNATASEKRRDTALLTREVSSYKLRRLAKHAPRAM